MAVLGEGICSDSSDVDVHTWCLSVSGYRSTFSKEKASSAAAVAVLLTSGLSSMVGLGFWDGDTGYRVPLVSRLDGGRKLLF